MIITAKNLDKILDRPRYIIIPKASIAATLILHTIIINIACVLLYGVWAYVGIPLLFAELFIQLTLLLKMWKRIGYSKTVFIIGLIINITINAFVAIPERSAISAVINAAFMQ